MEYSAPPPKAYDRDLDLDLLPAAALDGGDLSLLLLISLLLFNTGDLADLLLLLSLSPRPLLMLR